MLRPSLLILALVAGGPMLPIGAAVAAPAPIAESGLLAFLPVGEVAGEGSVEVQVLALEATGAPMVGLTLTPSASSGKATNWRVLSPGLYAFDYIAPRVTQATRVSLSASGQVTGRGSLSASLDIEIRPGAAPISATPKPAAITLGKAEGATLVIERAGPIAVRTSSGEIADVTDMGAKKTVRLLAPKVNIPHVAIVVAADPTDPSGPVGVAVVRLEGAVDFPLKGLAPNASVTLKIGEAEYGPVVADASGAARVPIVVPPGVGKAIQRVKVDGETTEAELDLKIPPQKRIVLAPLPTVVPADPAVGVPLRAIVRTPTGEPDVDATPTFVVSSGTVGEAMLVDPGVYVATWNPGAADLAGTATVEVKLPDSPVNVDQVEVKTAPRRIGALTVVEATEAEETVTLVVEAGIGRTLTVDAQGGTVTGTEDRGDGTFAVALARGEGPLEVDAFVAPVATDNPLRQVVLAPGTERIANDGETATTVTVATVDAFGYPVSGQPVTLTVDGDGKLASKTVTTDAHGLARVEYVSGTAASLVRLRGTSGAAVGAAAVVQAPNAAVEDLPIGGAATARAIHAAWSGSALEWRLAAAAASPVVDLAPAGADAKTVDLVAEPMIVRPGGEVVVTVIPRAEDGKPIPGQALDVLTSAGTVGAVEEDQGTYRATVAVPKDATGVVKVSVIAPSGAMKLVEVTADPNAAAPVASVAKPEKAPKAPKAPKVPKVPTASTEAPWMRVGLAGFGSRYRYEQAPSAEPGELLPQSLSVSSATPVGGQLEARAWLPDLTYLGFHGLVRASQYAIEAAAFGETVPDTLLNVQVDVAGRYPFEIGADQFWIGAKAGFHYNDFLLFKGCLEPGCTASYEALRIPGIGLGAEMGAEVGKLFFLTGYTQGLAYGTVAYSNTIDVDLGYQLHRNAFADLGFTSVTRRTALVGTDTGIERGSLDDAQLIFKVGGGVSF